MTTDGDDEVTPHVEDPDVANNLCAAGGVFAALRTAGLDPQVEMNDGRYTNAITVEFSHMMSRYRLRFTVERIESSANTLLRERPLMLMPSEVAREHVTIEVENGDGWTVIGSVADIEPPASFSSETSDGREVYVAGWLDDQGPCIWRSTGGVDVVTDAFREVFATGFVVVADLRNGPEILELCPGRTPPPTRVRFSWCQP